MIQLSFQPALDPFHSMFRVMRMRDVIAAAGELSVDHVRIMDFYLAFPFRIDGIRVLPAHKRFRRLAKVYEKSKPYGEQPMDAALFARMSPIQTAAIESLASNGIFDASRLRASWVKPTERNLPEEILSRVAEINGADEELLEFIEVLATEYHVAGANGLKHRTGLMEYRYDAV
jgi:hypothetical protein